MNSRLMMLMSVFVLSGMSPLAFSSELAISADRLIETAQTVFYSRSDSPGLVFYAPKFVETLDCSGPEFSPRLAACKVTLVQKATERLDDLGVPEWKGRFLRRIDYNDADCSYRGTTHAQMMQPRFVTVDRDAGEICQYVFEAQKLHLPTLEPLLRSESARVGGLISTGRTLQVAYQSDYTSAVRNELDRLGVRNGGRVSTGEAYFYLGLAVGAFPEVRERFLAESRQPVESGWIGRVTKSFFEFLRRDQATLKPPTTTGLIEVSGEKKYDY